MNLKNADTSKLDSICRRDFESFMRKAFKELHPGKTLSFDPYLTYLCQVAERIATGERPRTVINLPPGHLKTFLFSTALVAWILMHDPTNRIMVVTNAQDLAEQITYSIRDILRSGWFKRLSNTRIKGDRKSASDFMTTREGRVFATSIDGKFTGQRADIIIADDLLDIGEAGDDRRVQEINNLFQTKLLSRLNDPIGGPVLVVAHRVHEHDLTASLKAEGGWDIIALELVAARNRTYQMKSEDFARRKGDVLRAGYMSAKRIEQLRQTPSLPEFWLLYQQGRGPRLSFSLGREDFPLFEAKDVADLPVVVRVDAGQKPGGASRHAVQVWKTNGREHHLVEALSLTAAYPTLRKAMDRIIRKYTPSHLLIEDTCAGSSLISELLAEGACTVVPISPRKSKAERLAAHIRHIKKKRVRLRKKADWLGDVLTQFIEFPNGRDDHVDAMTQFLDFMVSKPKLAPTIVKKRATSVLLPYSRALPYPAPVRGFVVARGQSIFGTAPLAPPHSPGWGSLAPYFPNLP